MLSAKYMVKIGEGMLQRRAYRVTLSIEVDGKEVDLIAEYMDLKTAVDKMELIHRYMKIAEMIGVNENGETNT